jgi:hypothetical protein
MLFKNEAQDWFLISLRSEIVIGSIFFWIRIYLKNVAPVLSSRSLLSRPGRTPIFDTLPFRKGEILLSASQLVQAGLRQQG